MLKANVTAKTTKSDANEKCLLVFFFYFINKTHRTNAFATFALWSLLKRDTRTTTSSLSAKRNDFCPMYSWFSSAHHTNRPSHCVTIGRNQKEKTRCARVWLCWCLLAAEFYINCINVVVPFVWVAAVVCTTTLFVYMYSSMLVLTLLSFVSFRVVFFLLFSFNSRSLLIALHAFALRVSIYNKAVTARALTAREWEYTLHTFRNWMGGPVSGAADITYLLAHHIRCKRTVAKWGRFCLRPDDFSCARWSVLMSHTSRYFN